MNSRKLGCRYCGKYFTLNSEVYSSMEMCCSVSCRIRYYHDGESLPLEERRANYDTSREDFDTKLEVWRRDRVTKRETRP